MWVVIVSQLASEQAIMNDRTAAVGNATAAPGPLAIDISPPLTTLAILN